MARKKTDDAPAQAIEVVPIDSVHEDPSNARLHPEKNLSAIKASLARFGQITPLVIDGDNVVRKGNGTLRAARELGWQAVRVVRTTLKGVDAAAYAVADNRTSELATWDDTVLAATLEAIRSEPDFPLAATGFDEAEVDALMESIARDQAGPLEFAADTDDDDDIGANGDDGDEPPPSHVRMVQLFLNTDTFPRFNRMVEALGERFATDNATDTVMACLRELTGDHGDTD